VTDPCKSSAERTIPCQLPRYSARGTIHRTLFADKQDRRTCNKQFKLRNNAGHDPLDAQRKSRTMAACHTVQLMEFTFADQSIWLLSCHIGTRAISDQPEKNLPKLRMVEQNCLLGRQRTCVIGP
jgi:hypothetical protein